MSNDEGITNANIIVDLDAIMDTRLPTLYAMDPGRAISMTSDDSYQLRVKDSFGNISYDIFKVYYDNRNKNILKLATPTPALDLVKDYSIDSNNCAITQSIGDIPTLYLNIYPYDLNEEECGNLLTMLHHVLPARMNLETINMSNSEMTPKYVQEIASSILKYDMLEWLEYHNSIGNLTRYPMLGIACVGPTLANGDAATKDLSQLDFDKLRSALAPLANLVLVQTRVFSSK
jgi:hypothetical protein